MKTYNHNKIEPKWQKEWEEQKLYEMPDAVAGKENYYLLFEYPYPSGNLHIGHWYAFSIPDIFARTKRMQGYNVLFPIGFDSYGLPAENAAIKHGVNPREWTDKNIETMKQQLRTIGASFDWNREVSDHEQQYHRWTQWLFLQFYKNDLAYQAVTRVNWCPSCKTVLANEQVIAGHCERCDHEVEKKEMKQWMLRITKYAQSLLDDLEPLDWPEEIKESQRNWIGRSEGAEIKFTINHSQLTIDVFTTRPDTIYGATYMVLAPEHELIAKLKSSIANYEEVAKYVKKAQAKTELQRQQAVEKEKTGVELKGVKAINPATKEEIPVWVADYVLMGYGTGAIMAVPAHDQRDYEFAKNNKLKIKYVIAPKPDMWKVIMPDSESMPSKSDSDYNFITSILIERLKGWDPYLLEGIVFNSEKYDGLDSQDAIKKMTKDFGKVEVNYKMRDWVISRQRYWGAPIPIIYCEECGTLPVPDEDLPVLLPETDDYLPAGDGQSPLAKVRDWVEVTCPKCGGKAERETDTMDTFVYSSWYFFRYTDPKNEHEFAALDKMKKWLPVDLYSGGAEHTTVHVLYSRFFTKAMKDLGLIPWSEPFKRRMNRSLILGPDGQKMSKSRGNVVDPDEYVQKVGADTVRMYLAFVGPYNEVGSYPFDLKGIMGIRRFLDRIWGLISENSKAKDKIENSEIEKLLHKTIKKVTEDIAALKFNTTISQLMILFNEFNDHKEEVAAEQLKTFLLLLAPFAPHFAEELWQQVLGEKESIHLQSWPEYDKKLATDETVTVAVQINGKTRDTIEISPNISEIEASNIAERSEKVKQSLAGKEVKGIIYRPGKIINFVIK